MQIVTSFHPNRFYFSQSGHLVYILAVKNNRKEGLGVFVGPILAEACDNQTYCSSANLSSIKLSKSVIDESNSKFWHEIDLPKRLANRIYIVLREWADLFTRLSESMTPSILILNHAADDIPQGTINLINKTLIDKGGMWIMSPQPSYFEYPSSSFVFEDDKSVDEFKNELPHLTKHTVSE